MTVNELREELGKFPGDADVWIDAWGHRDEVRAAWSDSVPVPPGYPNAEPIPYPVVMLG